MVITQESKSSTMKPIRIYMAAWIGLMILAILNGVLREKSYGPFMTDLTAHQVSTVICIFIFSAYLWFFTGAVRLESSAHAISVGGIWLTMTLAFEFGFGHYVMGHSWGRLIQDYNLMGGRIWILVPVWTASAPWIFFLIRSRTK